jgi:hypothetical protein
MEKTFNTSQFSTKFTDHELEQLNEVLNILAPDFAGTKTEAFKIILTDYFKIKELYNVHKELIGQSDSLIDEIEKKLRTLEELDLQIQEKESQEQPNRVELSPELFTKFQIISFLAQKNGFIGENSIPELIEQILLHYQSKGFFVPTTEEIENAKIELGI